ncbi:MAG TPA: RNA polymerase-binding protein DksA [Fontimonas sp.]
MTAKKTVKSAKPAPAKSAKGKASGSSGLLSKIKGALSKKPAGKPAAKAAAKPAAKPAAKKAPAKATKKPAAPAKPSKPAKPAAKPIAKAAVKPAAKAAKPAAKPAAAKAVAAPVKAKPAAVSKPAAAPARSEARPVAASVPPPPRPTAPPVQNVPKAVPKKKLRPTVYTGALTEEILREMNDDEYMNDAQLDFFRRRLIQMRQEVLQRELDVKERLHEREVFADPADRATAEEEHWLDLRLRERESLLLRKVDDALRRIEAREFGYCEKTGDPIGIPRLLARPTATVCVDVKGQDERVEAQYRDR